MAADEGPGNLPGASGAAGGAATRRTDARPDPPADRAGPRAWLRRAGPALLLWALLMALAGWQIARTPFTADLSAFLPADPDPRQRVLIEQLQSGVPARTLLLAIEGGDARRRADASRALAAALRGSGLFEQVLNGETAGFGDVGRWLVDHRYALSPAVDADRFTAAGLRAAFAETLSLLGTPAGNAVKPLLERDPTGETVRIAESLIPSTAPRTDEGVWVARERDGVPPRALLVAAVRAPGADLDAQSRAIDAVRAAFDAQRAPALVLRVGGAPVFGVDSRARIEREIHWLAAGATVLMSGLLLAAFASLPALVVALLPVATGVVAGIAVAGTAFGEVHGITLGFGATLIGEAVDYAIYYLVQARQGGWRAWLARGWPTVRLGLLTSVCGFAALLFSGFPGLMQLGVFSLAGLLAAALFTRFAMPRLMPAGARAGGLRAPLGRAARRAAAWLPRLRRPLLALGAAALALLLWRHDRLWQAELSSLSPVPAEMVALDESLRADLSAGDARTLVVVQGPTLEAALQAAERVAPALDRLTDAGAIGGHDSVARWLPSAARQAERRAALPAPAALRAALDEAVRGGPLTAARLEPFVVEVDAARTRAPVTRESLRGTAAAPVVDALLLQRADGSWASLLPLQPRADGGLDTGAVRRALAGDAAPAGTQVIEIGPELTRLYARYLAQAQRQSLLGALAVLALMALVLRSAPRLWAVSQPLVLAVVLTMGGFAAAGAPLGILHLVGLLLVVAVGSNYALFFDLLRGGGGRGAGAAATAGAGAGAGTAGGEGGGADGAGGADDDTLASLVLANLTTVGGFGLIALSTIPALSAIGRVVAPGALLALVLSAAFVGAAARKRADLER